MCCTCKVAFLLIRPIVVFSPFSFSSPLKPGFHKRIIISISTSTYVSKWKLGPHKHNHRHKKKWQVRSFCACAYAYFVALSRLATSRPQGGFLASGASFLGHEAATRSNRTKDFFESLSFDYSENRLDISSSIRQQGTRPWTNHRSLSPKTRANISKAIWRTLCPSSCLSWGWGDLVSRIDTNITFCACVCPYAYAYALVKTRL